MNLDKKMIAVLIVCTVLGGIVGGVIGSFAGRGGREFSNYRNGGNMMQRSGGFGRGNQYGNWNAERNAQQAPLSASTTSTQ